jgi:hypothetical protein
MPNAATTANPATIRHAADESSAIRTYIGLSERVLHAVFAISLQLSARHVLEIPQRPSLDEAVHRLGRPMAWASLYGS